jgi:hypothetical protein
MLRQAVLLDGVEVEGPFLALSSLRPLERKMRALGLV